MAIRVPRKFTAIVGLAVHCCPFVGLQFPWADRRSYRKENVAFSLRPATMPLIGRLSKTAEDYVKSALVSAFVALLAVPLSSQAPAQKPAVPLEAISAILDAFKVHQVVALGEGSNGNERGHAFSTVIDTGPTIFRNGQGHRCRVWQCPLSRCHRSIRAWRGRRVLELATGLVEHNAAQYRLG